MVVAYPVDVVIGRHATVILLVGKCPFCVVGEVVDYLGRSAKLHEWRALGIVSHEVVVDGDIFRTHGGSTFFSGVATDHEPFAVATLRVCTAI